MCASHTANGQPGAAVPAPEAPVQLTPASADASAATGRSALASALVWLGVAAIKAYQITLSPFMGQHCRFIPTCSHYGVEALRVHGPIKGSWLTLRRLSRCHPLGGKSGWDPVPLPDHLAHATPPAEPSSANHYGPSRHFESNLYPNLEPKHQP